MPDVVELASAFRFDDTVERLAAAIAQAGVPAKLAERLNPAQQLLVKALTP